MFVITLINTVVLVVFVALIFLCMMGPLAPDIIRGLKQWGRDVWKAIKS